MADDTANRALRAENAICFVMMPFGPQFDRYYRNIFVPAINSAGLEAVRGDSIFGPSAIMADIWQLLKRSVVGLADLTGRNPNVFYELGLAHAAGKAVILIASNNDDIPFDLKGLRAILYDKDDEDWGRKLQSEIERSIARVRADPVRALPATFLEAAARPHIDDPIQNEVRRLAEEVRAIRLGGVRVFGVPPATILPREDRDTLLTDVFPKARAVGLNWVQAQHILDLVYAGKASEATSYIEATGVGLSDARGVVEAFRRHLLSAAGT